MATSHSDSDLNNRNGLADTPTSYDNDNNSGAGPSSSTSNRKRKGGSNSSKSAKKRRVDSNIDFLDENTVPVGSEAWDEKGSYSKSGLANTLHGVIYQLKLLMLFLKLAYDQGCRFRLATEMDDAEKFDDLVLEYEKNPGSRKHRFVQLKHKQEDSKTISAHELLADDDGDFSLMKYFRSWCEIKKNPKFAGSKKRFILCTNIGLNKEELEKGNIKVEEVNQLDDFLNLTPDWSKCYKLLPDPQSNRELYEKLKSASDLHQLAKELATYVGSSKKLYLGVDIFKRYHVALAKENILDINTDKFADKFIDNKGLSSKAEKFREIFYEHAKKFEGNKNAREKDIWNRLKSHKFKKSKDFGASSSGSQLDELPDADISDKKISKFLKNFSLAVNQPNEKQLDELIAHEFRESSPFKLLNLELIRGSFQNDILKWFKKKSGKYLNRKDAKKIVGALGQRLSSLITVGLTLRYTQQLKEYNVRWKDENEAVRTFLQSSNSNKKRIMLQITSSEQTLLTASRIYQTVMSMDEYKKEEDSFIFMKLKHLLPPESMSHVFNAFSSPANHNLLVIDFGLHSADLNTNELWKEMRQTMKELRAKKIDGKRVIIIIPQQDMGIIRLESLNCENSYETEDDISIDKMKRSTRRKLLEKEVIEFQGRDEKTSYGCLLGGENFAAEEVEKTQGYKKIMNPKTLVKIIHGTEIRIGVELEGLDEVKDFYISRTIERHVVIKNDIFKFEQGLDDIFAIGSIDETTLQKLWEDENRKEVDSSQERKYRDPEKYVILQNGREKDDFDTLRREKPDCIIHWLQRESGKLVWKVSHGSIANLVKYREEIRSDGDAEKHGVIPVTEEEQADCRDDQPKIIILSDTAGMGKSTVSTRLAEKIKDHNPNLLVIKINLNDHTTVLKTEQHRRFDSHDFNDAVDFLVDKLIRGLEPEAVSLFKMMIKARRRAALLFDGFDEISPYYKEMVVNLIRTLSKLEVKKLFVTTRPHTSRDLEEKLEVFSHTLRLFSEANQVEFLTKFWASESKIPLNKAGIKRHAKQLIALLTKTIDRSMQEFTGVPLQTRMVAEVFPYVEGRELTEELPETITMIKLYDKFVEKKCKIYMEDKSDRDSTKPDYMENYQEYLQTFSNKHHKFALDVLFDPETVGLLMPHQSSDTITDEAMTRKGMIIQFIDGKPQFIHRTFAEYFAAKYLFKILIDYSPNQQVQEFFVGRLFLEPEYRVIRAFLNCLLADKVLVGQEKSWKFYLKDHLNLEGVTAHHVAVKESHLGIIKLLLNRLTEDSRLEFSNIDCRAKNDYTPLAVAVEVSENFEIMKCFIDAGADVNNYSDLSPLGKAFHSDVISDVIKYFIEKSKWEVEPKTVTSALSIAAQMGKLDLMMYLKLKGGDLTSCNHEGGNNPLHVAAQFGRQDVVQYLIEMHASVDYRNDEGQTPLHLAAASQQLDTLKCLVKNHAKIDHRDTFGNTPLHLAARDLFVLSENENGLQTPVAEVVEYLLSKGADINLQPYFGGTLLHNAASDGNFDLLKFSLAKGIDINSRSSYDGQTALHMAAMHYVSHMDTKEWPATVQSKLIKYLRKQGADIHSETKRGETPLYFAAKRGNIGLVNYFREQEADIRVKTKDGETLLHAAVERGSIAIMEYLIGEGLDIEAQTEDGKTLLHYAAAFNRLDLVQFFKKKGVKINSKTKKGKKTPLHEATWRGHLDIVEYLIENGADIRSRTDDGRTCMHYAARSGRVEMVKYLEKNGADIHSRTDDGRTCMHYAAQSGGLDVVKYLEDKCEDIHSPSNDGTTPLHLAVIYYNASEMDEFEDPAFKFLGKDRLPGPMSAFERAAMRVVYYLANEGADINCKTGDGWTPLHLAAKGDALRVVEILTLQGADIHRQTRDGKTPLQVATEHQAIYVRNYLMKKLEEKGKSITYHTRYIAFV